MFIVNEEKIRVKAEDGNEYLFYENGEFFKGFSEYECLLFPSKTNRDWDNFNQEDLRFDPKTLNPFDKVLVRDDNNYQWSCSLFSHVSIDDNTLYMVTLDGCTNYQTIPYNDETKHLLGTKDGAPQFYRYWED